MSDHSYRTALKPIWCPGCGDYAVLKALTDALKELDAPPHLVGLFSGIGCSARIAGYVDCYAFNLLHGRAIPVAEGAKLARPELTVFAIGGDGDLLSIGGGHLAHAVRSNIDITVLCVNNHVYGLTKGQTSPTTPQHLADRSTGSPSPVDPVFNTLSYSIGSHASFVAQGISSDTRLLKDLIVQATRHRGFSFVNILTRCPTYRGEAFEALRARCVYLDASHDANDLNVALALAETPIDATPHLGVFFRGRAPET